MTLLQYVPWRQSAFQPFVSREWNDASTQPDADDEDASDDRANDGESADDAGCAHRGGTSTREWCQGTQSSDDGDGWMNGCVNGTRSFEANVWITDADATFDDAMTMTMTMG